MLLRRVGEAVRKQNWVTVLIELLVVMNALRERQLHERDRAAFEEGLGVLDVVITLGWTMATVDELVSSGELGLVRDAEHDPPPPQRALESPELDRRHAYSP